MSDNLEEIVGGLTELNKGGMSRLEGWTKNPETYPIKSPEIKFSSAYRVPESEYWHSTGEKSPNELRVDFRTFLT